MVGEDCGVLFFTRASGESTELHAACLNYVAACGRGFLARRAQEKLMTAALSFVRL